MKKKLLFLMALFWSAWSFGQNVTTFAGAGNTGNNDATGTASSFNGLRDVDIDASGNLYVTDSGNNKIQKITAEGVVTTFAGSGTQGSTDGTIHWSEFKISSKLFESIRLYRQT